MPISFNGFGNPESINYNDQPVKEVYFNGDYIWPDSTTIYYKYVFLERIKEFGVDANAYELHLSREDLGGYKESEDLPLIPKWQERQENVKSPEGQVYATPMAFVRRVVIDNHITPKHLTGWFMHLYGGLNDTEEMVEKHPFEWVGFDKIRIYNCYNMDYAFEQCHSGDLDLSKWYTKLVTSTNKMFDYASPAHIWVGDGWNMANVANSEKMFHQCVYLHNFKSKYVDKTYAIIDDGHNGGYLEKRG